MKLLLDAGERKSCFRRMIVEHATKNNSIRLTSIGGLSALSEKVQWLNEMVQEEIEQHNTEAYRSLIEDASESSSSEKNPFSFVDCFVRADSGAPFVQIFQVGPSINLIEHSSKKKGPNHNPQIDANAEHNYVRIRDDLGCNLQRLFQTRESMVMDVLGCSEVCGVKVTRANSASRAVDSAEDEGNELYKQLSNAFGSGMFSRIWGNQAKSTNVYSIPNPSHSTFAHDLKLLFMSQKINDLLSRRIVVAMEMVAIPSQKGTVYFSAQRQLNRKTSATFFRSNAEIVVGERVRLAAMRSAKRRFAEKARTMVKDPLEGSTHFFDCRYVVDPNRVDDFNEQFAAWLADSMPLPDDVICCSTDPGPGYPEMAPHHFLAQDWDDPLHILAVMKSSERTKQLMFSISDENHLLLRTVSVISMIAQHGFLDRNVVIDLPEHLLKPIPPLSDFPDEFSNARFDEDERYRASYFHAAAVEAGVSNPTLNTDLLGALYQNLHEVVTLIIHPFRCSDRVRCASLQNRKYSNLMSGYQRVMSLLASAKPTADKSCAELNDKFAAANEALQELSARYRRKESSALHVASSAASAVSGSPLSDNSFERRNGDQQEPEPATVAL